MFAADPANEGLQRPPTPQTEPPARLPKVLLIGDSITSDYTAKVQDLLRGKAEVINVSAGGGHTTPALEKLDD